MRFKEKKTLQFQMALCVQKLMLESVHIFNGGFKQKLKNETVSVDIVIHFGWNNLFRRIRAMKKKAYF